MKIILSSASARREELLKKITEEFFVYPTNVDESIVKYDGDCAKYVMEIAKLKAVSNPLKKEKDSIIIGCDTVVFHEGKVLGKPKDYENAFRMLNSLSGKTHEVYSGIAVLHNNNFVCDYAVTKVTFDNLDSKDIEKYIETGEPMDKAGAYGIQGHGGLFVQGIEGSYYNVVGLPINKLYKILKGMGVN